LEALALVDVESCGKSRIHLNGLAVELHKRNLRFLYRQMAALKKPKSNSPPEKYKLAIAYVILQ
jgi:hypothetical protein